MDSLVQDIRYTLRTLRKSPSFTAIAALTLALGIGANTAIFSVLYAVLLRPLPYPDAERLFTLPSNQSFLDVEDMKAEASAFDAVGTTTYQALDLTGAGDPVQVQAALAGRGLFTVLGGNALVGRTFSAGEDRLGGDRVAVLSYAFWQGRFGGDAGLVGKPIQLSGNPYTVVGVLPPSFRLPETQPDVFVPLLVANPTAAQVRGAHFLRVFLHLRPGASLSQAQAQMDAAALHLAEKDPAESKGRTLRLVTLHARLAGETRPALLVLFGAVVLLLLIASGNFANLLFGRAVSRRRELVIRTALGAGRGRLLRQLLTESLLLALVGGALGLLIAPWILRLLVALRPTELPPVFSIGLDPAVLGYALLISLATGVLFGLAPAIGFSRTDVSEGLAESGRSGTASAGRGRLTGLLVVGELALALVLVVASGLLLKAFSRLRSAEPGFVPDGVTTMRIELPESRYQEVAQQAEFRRRLLDGLAALPGAEAGFVSELPLSGEWLNHNMAFEGRPPVAAGDEPEVMSRSVGGDYLHLMRVPLLRGRGFTKDDRLGAPLVGVVNEAMVRQHFGGADPIGKRVRWARLPGAPQWITVVGVVGDVRHFGLELPDQAALYTPYDQSVQSWKRWMCLVIRAGAEPAALEKSVKERLAGIDADLPLTKVRPMTAVMASSLARQRFSAALLGLFAMLALFLSASGVYGVMSHAVSQRTREMGIRIALGAAPARVLGLVVGQGMRLAAWGIGIGLAAALSLTRLLRGLLYGLSPTDPGTFLTLTAVLGGVALAACAFPALRATRVDPIAALHDE